jgi:hypothetical protein
LRRAPSWYAALIFDSMDQFIDLMVIVCRFQPIALFMGRTIHSSACNSTPSAICIQISDRSFPSRRRSVFMPVQAACERLRHLLKSDQRFHAFMQMETGCAALEESLGILILTHGGESPMVNGLQQLLSTCRK